MIRQTVSSLLVVLLCFLVGSGANADDQATPTPKPAAASRALQKLKDGNERFVLGEPRHPHEARNWRAKLEEGQTPSAVIVGCSDSRVPPELIFDQGFGDLFVVRVAGNIVDTDVTASVEYAVDHLQTHLVVVMGHTNCGAVTATLDHWSSPGSEPAEILSLFYQIEPALEGTSSEMTRDEQIEYAVKRNVELAVRRLSRVPDIRRRIERGRIELVGAIYDMHTGRVEMLEPEQAESLPSRDAPTTRSSKPNLSAK